MRKLLATAVAVGAMVLGMAAPASAETVSDSCQVTWLSIFHGNLSASGNYYTDGANHVWTDASGTLNGGGWSGTGGKSNVNMWLRANGSVVWSHFSPDNVGDGVPYSTGIGKTVSAAANENLSIQGIFDVSGPDPKCTATNMNA